MKQKTVTNQICARGIGRDSNKVVHITIKPALENVGIVFRRVDLDTPIEIPASVDNARVEDGQLVFTCNGYRVGNTEHLLAACYGAGVHNLYIEIDGDELPKMTESASAYVFLLQSAGIKEQEATRAQIKIDEPQLFRRNKGWIRATSFEGLRVGCVNTLTENSVSVQRSSSVVDITEAVFVSELCYAQPGAGSPGSESGINKTATKNKRQLIQRSQLNHMVVEVMAYLFLTDADVDGCYTSFDADVSLHLDAIRAMKDLSIKEFQFATKRYGHA